MSHEVELKGKEYNNTKPCCPYCMQEMGIELGFTELDVMINCKSCHSTVRVDYSFNYKFVVNKIKESEYWQIIANQPYKQALELMGQIKMPFGDAVDILK